jgi:hypothetical protein
MEPSKYPRTYHFPFSLGTTSDDRIKHDWQSLLQHEVVITEKLDGENSCLKTDGVFARSHGAPTLNPWAKNMWDLHAQHKMSLGNYHIFGENLYGIHSIEYERLEHYFYIFAIREGDKWLAWDEVSFLAQLLDMPTVPVVSRGLFNENEIKMIVDNTLKTGSALGGLCEGIVCRNAQAFETATFSDNVLKYVRRNHVKTDEHWTRNWKRAKLWFEQSSQIG